MLVILIAFVGECYNWHLLYYTPTSEVAPPRSGPRQESSYILGLKAR